MKKIVLITGGSKGIGFGIAKAFLKNNYHVIITGRTLKTLQKAKEELSLISQSIEYFVADGSSEDDVINVINQIKNKYNRLDTLINNAQTSKSGFKLIEHTKNDFDLAINSGLYATFYYMKYAYPLLKETQGSVINFASGAGISGRFGQSSYAASKEGIRGLSRVAATEWGSDNIRVNVICPLVMTDKLVEFKEQYPELYNQSISEIPLKRFGDSEKDVGSLCVFLSSDKASYITGQTISMQGGLGLSA